MSKIDYDADNYSINELLQILGIENPSQSKIKEVTNNYINKFSPSNEDRPELVNFFQDIQTKLLDYMETSDSNDEDSYESNDEQTNQWIQNTNIPQQNSNQNNKITDRKQQVDVYNNNHVPMAQNQLGVNNTFQLPVAQGSLNPTLKNTTFRFINLDSQFRQPAGGTESLSTNYTMDLSDPLTKVLSLKLYSFQIPYTWYVIDYNYGNTCFWVTNPTNDDGTGTINTFDINIEPGNYSPSDFCNELNTAFINAGFTYTDTENIPLIATYNQNNGKITMTLNTSWNDPLQNILRCTTQYTDTFDSTKHAYFTFFDITGNKKCNTTGTFKCSSSGQGNNFDNTLGWLMGYRTPIQPIFIGGNFAQSIINLNGTKYFIITLDDYNQNHINNGLVTITELSKTMRTPSYINNSQPYACTTNNNSQSLLDINAIGNLSNITNSEAISMGINPINLFYNLQEKYENTNEQIQQFIPSAPRTLTQAQIYTANEIIKNQSKTLNFRSTAPTNSDTFAIIPIKYSSMTTGELYTEISGQFQDNKRVYFGPVDIERLKITLYDDKGNIVDLHGADWAVTMISENLYQY